MNRLLAYFENALAVAGWTVLILAAYVAVIVAAICWSH